jgi:glycosyltransferase involved in cell wall biosynthesis
VGVRATDGFAGRNAEIATRLTPAVRPPVLVYEIIFPHPEEAARTSCEAGFLSDHNLGADDAEDTAPVVDAPFVSVIVPVFDQRALLVRCLDALEKQTYPAECYEVVVVDNGCRDPVAHAVAQFPHATAVVETQPGSYAARNAGVRLSRGSVLAFTDADCIPEPAWLEAAVIRLLMMPSAGVVGGRVVLFPANNRRVTTAEVYDMTFWMRQRDYLELAGFAATANLVMHRSVFERVGPFDARLMSSGDAQWGRRARGMGVLQEYGPEAVVRHPARQTVRAVLAKATRVSGGYVQCRAHYGIRELLADVRTELRSWGVSWRHLRAADRDFSLWRGVKFAALLGIVGAVAMAERARVMCGGTPRRR